MASPEKGLVLPDSVIPCAEKTGFIRALSQWMLEHAATVAGDLVRAGTQIAISVNQSARDTLDQDRPIDDFGTGYASLVYLKRLPVHELKIDKSFTMNIERNIADAKIVHSIVDLGHNLGLCVVAEGVETLAVWRLLQTMGCDQGQGYFISKPMPGVHFTDWLKTWRAPGASTPADTITSAAHSLPAID